MPLIVRKRKGSPNWEARGTITVRLPDGSLGSEHFEKSTRVKSKPAAQKIADDWWQYYHNLAVGKIEKRSPTFAQAAVTYLETRGKGDRFLDKLIKFFGETPIAEIDQGAIAHAAQSLYPGRSASTHNRAVFSPMVTILRLSGRRPDFSRPRIEKRPIRVPSDEWFDAIAKHAPDRLLALIYFLTLTGRRVSEAIALTEADLDGTTVSIRHTKTGVPVTLELPSLVVDLLERASRGRRGGPGHRPSSHLFGYSTKDNAHRALKRICGLHGLPYFSSHKFGRHAFATRLLKQGWSVKHVARAGGWKSPVMVLKHYGWLEQDEVQSELRKVNDEWSVGRTREGKKK